MSRPRRHPRADSPCGAGCVALQECDQLLATQPIQLFHKMFEFVKDNLDLGEADLEGAFHCLFLLLRRLADGEVTLAVTNIVTVLTGEASRPTLRLRM
jgi:hypothetical protein